MIQMLFERAITPDRRQKHHKNKAFTIETPKQTKQMKNNMKLNHTLLTVVSLALASASLHAGAPAMCGTVPGAAEVADAAKSKSAVQRSAEEMVAQLAPERQSDLLILLNEATQERLLTISGIAATRATAIINARPITSLSELVGVKGIGVTTLSRILAFDPNAQPATAVDGGDPSMTKQEG
jgi:DNA uptake protein ComE-like DNA-binding protein